MPRPHGTISLDVQTIRRMVELRKTKSISEISKLLVIPKSTVGRYLQNV